MTIYIDSDYRCHTEAAEGRTAVQTDAFDGKSTAYIEGMRFVPAGETWTREDGRVFVGTMVTPWRDSKELEQVQREYERQQLADALADRDAALAALSEMGVSV